MCRESEEKTFFSCASTSALQGAPRFRAVPESLQAPRGAECPRLRARGRCARVSHLVERVNDRHPTHGGRIGRGHEVPVGAGLRADLRARAP